MYNSANTLSAVTFCKSHVLPYSSLNKIQGAISSNIANLPLAELLPLVEKYCIESFYSDYLSRLNKRELADAYLNLRQQVLPIPPVEQSTETNVTRIPETITQPLRNIPTLSKLCEDVIENNATTPEDNLPIVVKKKKKSKRVKTDVILTSEGPAAVQRRPELLEQQITAAAPAWYNSTPYFPSICEKKECFLCLTHFLGGMITPCVESCDHVRTFGYYIHHSASAIKKLKHLHSINAVCSVIFPSPHQNLQEGCRGPLSNYLPLTAFPTKVRRRIEMWADKASRPEGVPISEIDLVSDNDDEDGNSDPIRGRVVKRNRDSVYSESSFGTVRKTRKKLNPPNRNRK